MREENTERPESECLWLRPKEPDLQLLHNQDKCLFLCSRRRLVMLVTFCIFVMAYWPLGVVVAIRRKAPGLRRRARPIQLERKADRKPGLTVSKAQKNTHEDQTQYISNRTPLVYIHIGKTGGGMYMPS